MCMMENLKESYESFDWQIIKDYCLDLEKEDFSKVKTVDDIFNKLNDYFDILQIDFQNPPYSLDEEPWKDSYVFNGATYSNGFIVIYVDFQNILEALTGTCYKHECVVSLATTVVHEMMHRYQTTAYSDRHWNTTDSEDEYLAKKDEISAHIIGGITELLSTNYTRKDLIKALRTIDTDLENGNSPFWESNSLYVYWDRFGSFDTKDKVWLRFKKELSRFLLQEN